MPRGYPAALRHLGGHVRRRRLELGLRQRDLAARLNVREETLAAWERGQAQPLPRHYGAIVAFLGCDPVPAGDGLPARLSAARRRLGLTQAELAERLGLDEGTVADFERGCREPTPRVRAAVDRFLGQEGMG